MLPQWSPFLSQLSSLAREERRVTLLAVNHFSEQPCTLRVANHETAILGDAPSSDAITRYRRFWRRQERTGKPPLLSIIQRDAAAIATLDTLIMYHETNLDDVGVYVIGVFA